MGLALRQRLARGVDTTGAMILLGAEAATAAVRDIAGRRFSWQESRSTRPASCSPSMARTCAR